MGKPGAQIVGCANLVFNRPTEERPKSTSTWRGRTHRPGSLQRQFVRSHFGPRESAPSSTLPRSHPGEVDHERMHKVTHAKPLFMDNNPTNRKNWHLDKDRCSWVRSFPRILRPRPRMAKNPFQRGHLQFGKIGLFARPILLGKSKDQMQRQQ